VAELIEKVRSYIDTEQLIPKGSTVIIGLSGGPDSVCLLTVLTQLKQTYQINLIAAHLNHKWRSAADQDEQFCRDLCSTIQIPFHSKSADQITLKKKPNGSLEEQGRLLRRTYFEELATEYKGSHIALAHHNDDQLETFLIRLVRGASVTGLASMKSANGRYIRPLLCLDKKEILSYLHENQLPFCHDETNDDESILRNAIRKKIIPAFTQVDARFNTNASRAIIHLQETDAFLNRMVDAAFLEVTQLENSQRNLLYDKFLESDEYLHQRILIRWLCEHAVPFSPSIGFFAEIVRFFKEESPSHTFNGWQIVKIKNSAVISQQKSG
jgi:tRNA(Ile)-lysidine synthase